MFSWQDNNVMNGPVRSLVVTQGLHGCIMYIHGLTLPLKTVHNLSAHNHQGIHQQQYKQDCTVLPYLTHTIQGVSLFQRPSVCCDFQAL